MATSRFKDMSKAEQDLFKRAFDQLLMDNDAIQSYYYNLELDKGLKYYYAFIEEARPNKWLIYAFDWSTSIPAHGESISGGEWNKLHKEWTRICTELSVKGVQDALERRYTILP